MRLTIAAFHGAFARRLFLRFMLAAAVPVLVVALLAYLNTTHVVIGQANDRLRHSSRNEGMAALDRLALAADLLQRVDSTDFRTPSNPAYPFEALGVVRAGATPGSNVRILLGERGALQGAAALAAAARRADRPVLRIVGPGALFMALSADSGASDAPVLIGRLRLSEIVGTADTWPTETRFCVFTAEGGRALNCPDAMAAYAATRNAAKLRVHMRGQQLLTAHWDLFLAANFEAPVWRIVGLQPVKYAGRSAHTFYWLLPPVLLISLLLAGLIGVIQIRRMSQPLRKLREGVQAIARGEFDGRVDIRSQDEFEELGEAVNGMARRLGTQFHTLETLAAVDRRILAAADMTEVVAHIILQMPRIVASDAVALIVLDPDLAQNAECYRYRMRADATVEISRLSLSEQDLKALDNEQTARVQSGGPSLASYIEPMAALGVTRIDMLPAREKGRLWASLLLGYDDESSSAVDDRAHGLAVADRIAVALAASHRSAQLYRQAHFDVLTGLPNRQLFMDRAETLLAQARRQARGFAVLFVDLDRFKNVNDAAGHSAGDELLEHAATRIVSSLRDVDTAARWGGDEFVVLIPDIEQPADIDRLCERLIDTLRESFSIGSVEYRVGASIGIAVYPDDGDSIETLLANADAAMYEAKSRGRGRRAFFEPRMNEAIRRRVQLETELQQAFAHDQFFLEYQPLIRPGDGEVGGAEALLRWRHPERGVVSPGEFIPSLEETGLIVEVGEWVLREACRQVAAGFTADGRAPAQVMVNVSPRQFRHDNFLATVDRALADTGIDPSRLEIEITENLLLTDLDAACEIAEALRARGIHLAMDDFGTGYSSLSYLRRLPVDTVKIDQAFAAGIEMPGSEAATMVGAMIGMLHALGRRVVVEGIENEAQFAFIRAAGCDLAQGFLMSRPVLPSALYDYRRPNID